MLAASLAMPALGSGHSYSGDKVIPTVFESGHFYAVPELANGKRMRLLLDTGGGTPPTIWINQAQADDVGIKADHACNEDGETYTAAHLDFARGEALPDLSRFCRGVIVLPNQNNHVSDGQIVPAYFMGGVWTFDYPKQQVVLHGKGWSPSNDAHRTPLGFKPLPGGLFAGWPRILIRVDGESLSMLLDTGATSKPTPQALKEDPMSTTDGVGVGSYIDASTLARWRTKHPDWKVIEQGDALIPAYSRMIRVPELDIAGWKVGPVWFIERPDRAFHSMMASLMDKPPEGAVGANVFEHFRMTIDYEHRNGWFQCISGCSVSRP
jgi:hypothetical protein